MQMILASLAVAQRVLCTDHIKFVVIRHLSVLAFQFLSFIEDEKFKPALLRRQFITSRFKIASSRPSSVPNQAVPGSKCNGRS